MVATITASPTGELQKRSPNANPVLGPAEIQDAAIGVAAGMTVEPSFTKSFSSACECRGILATATTEIVYTELPAVCLSL